jgi:CPA2 family monovalent cation:H+ antiporter-2
VRAGVEMITQALAAEARSGRVISGGPVPQSPPLEAPARLLPGLGAPRAVKLEPGGAAVGQTLKSLNLRGVTGATVLAINREGGSGGSQHLLPTGDEPLRANDTLVIAGSAEATAAAVDLLSAPAR